MKTAALFFGLFLQALWAQNRGQISGAVRDGTALAVPGVAVTVLNQLNGIRRTATTNDTGIYTVSTLPAGTYKVTVRKPGFRTVARLNIEVGPMDSAGVDFQLEVGGVQETLTVEGGATGLEKPPGGSVTTFTRETVKQLPLNGRGLQGLVDLAPGVVGTPATSGEAGQFTANGQRPNANYFLVDGVSANNAVSGTGLPGQFPGSSLPAMTAIGSLHAVAATAEIDDARVRTAAYAPEFGRLPGAQIAVNTRSGSNDFHGEAAYQFRHGALAANDWFANRAGLRSPKSGMQEFGMNGGGRLRRDRTFFFASLERLRLDTAAVWRTVSPSPTARRAADEIREKVLRGFAVANGQALSPLLTEHTFARSWPSTVTTGSLRVDQALGSRGVAFFRYHDVPSKAQSGYLQLNDARFRSRAFTAGAVVSLSPNMTNDVRVNISRSESSSTWAPVGTDGISQADLLAVLGPYSFGGKEQLQAVWIAGLGQLITGKGGRATQGQVTIADTLALTQGRHEWRFGADYQRITPARKEAFSGLLGSYAGLREFLGGTPPAITHVQAGAGSSLIETFSAFAQDTLRITPRLQAMFGVRWEWTPPPAYRIPAGSSGEFPGGVVGGGISPVFFPSVPAEAGVELTGAAVWKARANQFAPRAGLAWQLDQDGRTVLRTGAGMFYDLSFGSATDLLNGAPFNRWQNMALPGVASPGMQYGFAPDLRLPYSVQWSVSVERAFGLSQASVGYVGSAARRMLRRETYLDGTDASKLVLGSNGGRADYQALQVQYRRRVGRGLQAMASYTWGHSIDNGSWESALFLVYPKGGENQDRGSSSFDVRHSAQAALSYQLPGGWTISGMLRGRTGFPIDVVSTEAAFGLGYDNIRPDLIAGRSIWMDDPAAPGGRRLNPAAFRPAEDGRQGTLGRNAITGGGMIQTDAALQRRFTVSERVTVALRAEAYNLGNQARFADPVRLLSHPLFGEAGSQLHIMMGNGRPSSGLTPSFQPGGPRTVQLRLGISF